MNKKCRFCNATGKVDEVIYLTRSRISMCYECRLKRELNKEIPTHSAVTNTSLTKIKESLKDKKIVLIGNARSVLNKPRNIDAEFDIICRCNKGKPQGKEKYIGRRTDVLFLSTKIEQIKQQFRPKFTVWLTICTNLARDYVKLLGIQAPHEDWKELVKCYSIKYRPTTGCMALNFLNKHIDFKSLTVIGFDFFATKTWYNSGDCLKNHSPEEEKEIIMSIIKSNPKIEIENV